MKNKFLYLALFVPLFIYGCTSYVHITGYPGGQDKITSTDYKFLKTETYYFSLQPNSTLVVSSSEKDVLHFKDGGVYSGTIMKITQDSVVMADGKIHPFNYVSEIMFGDGNGNKESLKREFDRLKQNQRSFVIPSYSSLTNYVKTAYGANATFANAVWDVRKKGLGTKYMAVTFDVYVKD